MLKINKGNIPRIFHEVNRLYESYDVVPSEYKNKLKDILIQEQNSRCAYCNKRIDSTTSTIEHYIPRNGENGDISKSLDYNNLFAVCNTTKNLPFNKKTCDDRKGDLLLSIDPRNQSHIDTIKYDKKGTISSTNSVFNDDLNITLNLNSPTLVSNRFYAFDAIKRSIYKKHSGEWPKKLIKHTLERYKSKDDCTPYVGFIIYHLEKRLQKM